LSETVESALDKLFQVRYGADPRSLKTFPPARNNREAKAQDWPGRIPAVTDTKMIAAWNSLMISGLARAATVFNQPEYLQLATQAADFIRQQQWSEGRFHRLNYDGQPHVPAQSEDYALLIKALLDLHQVRLSGEVSVESQVWLEAAVQVQQEFDDRLWSPELGGYYNTASDASQDLLVRERSYADNAAPAANGVAIANLVRLALLTENLEYLDRAEKALQAFSSIMETAPQACPSLFVALDWYRNQTLVRTTSEYLDQLAQQYLPTAVYTAETNLPTAAIGLVCQGLSCKEPATSFEQLWEQLLQSQMRTTV
ncbi:MAG TPA: thioredoxin domain-containing protein, partial [Allocoleopsis sp.]